MWYIISNCTVIHYFVSHFFYTKEIQHDGGLHKPHFVLHFRSPFEKIKLEKTFKKNLYKIFKIKYQLKYIFFGLTLRKNEIITSLDDFEIVCNSAE